MTYISKLCIFAKTTLFMNRLFPISLLILLSVIVQSCVKSDSFELGGKIEGLDTNKLILVFDDPKSHIDSVFIREDKFVYSFNPDTVTMMQLVAPSGKSIPVFAHSGWDVHISGTFDHPDIKGDGPNADYAKFLKSIDGMSQTEVEKAVLEFTTKYFNSFASAYVVQNFLVNTEHPNDSLITKAIEPLTGTIKDCRLLSRIREVYHNKKSRNLNRMTFLSLRDRKNEYISLTSSKRECTLLNIWASWDKASVERRDSLYQLAKEIKDKRFIIVNYSLDYDKKSWLDACKKDTPYWIESCDFKGWDSQFIKSEFILSLPYNILIDDDRYILATNIYGKEFSDKVKQVLASSKKKR